MIINDNPNHPTYDLDNLPMCTESHYWSTIKKLFEATTKKAVDNIVKATGISCLPLCAASPAFFHPTFFPPDPFHLIYENCMVFIVDLWVKSEPADGFYISEEQLRKFGLLVSQAMFTLPPSFCGPIHDPFLKHHSQYNIYKWMALLHWYIIPISIELGFNSIVLQKFSHFVQAMEFSVTLLPRSESDLEALQKIIVNFLKGYEKICVGGNPEHISRFRLCIFQLIHIPQNILWNGSIRVGSQATVERSIGEMSCRICSKKAVFANLANQIHEREILKILLLYYPSLDCNKDKSNSALDPTHIKPVKMVKILKKELCANGSLDQHLQAISSFLGHCIHLLKCQSQII